MSILHIVIPEHLDGTRLDVALAELIPLLSRSAARRLIDDGLVTMNYGAARPARNVVANESITVDCIEQHPFEIVPSNSGISVVYQDNDVIIVDKPAGLTVHPGAGRDPDTLVHRLLGYDPAIAGGDTARPGIVHRLDKNTSGLIAIARTPKAHALLATQWRDRRVTKIYAALVEGSIEHADGIIDMPIGRHPRHRTRMAVIPTGRSARTTYQTTEVFHRHTLLDVSIETGRTHQIRVHTAAIGHPVAGDKIYGAQLTLSGLTRQFLHAKTLGLYLPSTGEYHEFSSPLPEELTNVLAQLK